MSVGDRPEPVRSCVGCRQRRPQSELVRVTKSDRGVEVGGASAGRGAWLCRGVDGDHRVEERCLQAAISRRAFSRAWRRDVDARDEQAIAELLGRGADDEHPDAH